MTVLVIVAGILAKPPVDKVAKTGRQYTSATLVDHETEHWWWLTAFASPARELLLACNPGDAIRISEKLRTSLFKPDDDEPRINHAVADISTFELFNSHEQSSEPEAVKKPDKSKKGWPLTEAELPF